ncbi:MAG: Fe-S cluster assembly protein HesB [Rhizobacter sp.]|nr:Fe-S cluster assembly protein HesB [Chlorobiales bacterium]
MRSLLPYCAVLPLAVPLNLEASLFCGQAFRWQVITEDGEKKFRGVVEGELVELARTDESIHGSLRIESTAPLILNQPLEKFFTRYLGLDDPIEAFFAPEFQHNYPDLFAASEHYFGLRVLHQAPFETLISFMCAQGMGIALIRRQADLLATNLGSTTTEQNFIPITAYEFPTAAQLAEAPLAALQVCTNNNSIRARNIKAVASLVARGDLKLETLASPHASLDEARNALMACSGIGEKIADCVCLFGLGHSDAFPIDTHVRQYLDAWFGLRTATQSLTRTGYDRLADEARKILGAKYAGHAGQILFHYWRLNVRGLTAV